jgi:hypothetical protein
VEVADDRHVHPHHRQPLGDPRHGSRGGRRVHRDAHQLGTGAGQLGDLFRRAGGVLGVGVGHRLHHDRRAAADPHLADLYGHAGPAWRRLGQPWFLCSHVTHAINRNTSRDGSRHCSQGYPIALVAL